MDMQPAEPGTIHCDLELVLDTMGDMLGTLPHGFLNEEGTATTYEFNRPNMKVRRLIGALDLNKKLQRHPGKKTCALLAICLKMLDGKIISDMKAATAELLISRLTTGDVMYLLFAWQNVMSPDGMMLGAAGCGVCGESFDRISVDLETMDVYRLPRIGDVYPTVYGDDHPDAGEAHPKAGAAMEVPTLGNPPIARVGLKDGMVHGKDEVILQTLLLKPALWVDTFYRIGAGQLQNKELIRAYTLQGMIFAALGTPLPRLPMDTIDELMPWDVEQLDDAGGQITPTLMLRVIVECPKKSCGHHNEHILDWANPVFGGGSTGA